MAFCPKTRSHKHGIYLEKAYRCRWVDTKGSNAQFGEGGHNLRHKRESLPLPQNTCRPPKVVFFLHKRPLPLWWQQWKPETMDWKRWCCSFCSSVCCSITYIFTSGFPFGIDQFSKQVRSKLHRIVCGPDDSEWRVKDVALDLNVLLTRVSAIEYHVLAAWNSSHEDRK